MTQERRDELQKVCEAILGYQKGLEEIDKYLGRLNGYMGQLGERLQEKQLDEVFCQYSAKIDSMTEGIAGIGARLQALQDGELLDAVTVLLDEAAQALMTLTGERVTEAVVDEVFRQFCVGR